MIIIKINFYIFEKNNIFNRIHEMIGDKLNKMPITQRRLEEIIYQYSQA
jgi:hypothetical protein